MLENSSFRRICGENTRVAPVRDGLGILSFLVFFRTKDKTVIFTLWPQSLCGQAQSRNWTFNAEKPPKKAVFRGKVANHANNDTTAPQPQGGGAFCRFMGCIWSFPGCILWGGVHLDKLESVESVFYCPEQVLFTLHAVLQSIWSCTYVQGHLYFGNLSCYVFKIFVPRKKRVLSPPQGQIIPVGSIQCESGTVFAALKLRRTSYFWRIDDYSFMRWNDSDRNGRFTFLGNGCRVFSSQQAV